MSLSTSVLSETSKDEAETEEKELQDLIWNLMSHTGLLSEMQGRISKFIEDNGKDNKVHVIPERADSRLLGLIFEYLQWVGMKQTNSVLLSESPVDVDLSVYESRNEDDNYKPELCRLAEEHNDTHEEEEEEEDRLSPSKSHNYSKDEFEESRMTSFTGHPSAKADEEDEIEDLASDNDNENKESETSHEKKEVSEQLSKQGSEKTSNSENRREVVQKSESHEKDNTRKSKPEVVDSGSENQMLIDFSSPIAKSRQADQMRPHVTVRHRLDLDEVEADPFQSPRRGVLEDKNETYNFFTSTEAGPAATKKFGFAKPVATPLGKVDEPPKQIINSDKVAEGGGDGLIFHETSVSEASKQAKSDNPQKDLKVGEVEDKSVNINKDEVVTKMVSQVPPEDDSTSDFMESLTIEEDTQDVSIPSDTKGMSSCEHAVNLK